MAVRILVICGSSGAGLLGQRDTLGVQAELQIDVSWEIRPFLRQAQGYSSQYIELDRNVGNTGLLLQEARNWLGGKSYQDLKSSVYLRREICSEADARHLQFLLDYAPATVSLERGKTLPAIMGLAIRHPHNRGALEQALEKMTAPLGLGPENPVEAWIVSSTVGGVGAGVHRFVGAFLADFIRQRYVGTPVLLNFIQIGPLAYRSVNPRQTALNAFFGVAADAAFALKLPQDFPGTTTQWFYVDFPDAGTGEHSFSLRERMVEIATKVIVWNSLRESLQGLLAYNQGIPMVVARIGFWEGGLAEQRKYYEALRGLRGRLRELVEPDYEQKFIKDSLRKPQLVAERLVEWIERAGDEEVILQYLESGWRFPRFPARRYPKSLEEVQAFAEEWKEVVQTLVGGRWEDLYAEWAFEGVAGQEFLRVAEPGDATFGSEIWFQQVEEAQRAIAWTRYLLGCDLRTGKPLEGRKENYLEELVTTARRLSSLLNGLGLFLQRRRRVQEAKEWLGKFVQAVAAVDTLLKLEARARHFLGKELKPALRVLEVTEAEFQKLWLQWAQPDYAKLITEKEPSFSFFPSCSTRLALLQNAENLETHLREGWRLRTYWAFPLSLAQVRERVAAWKEDLSQLLEEEWFSGGEFVVQRTVIQEGKREEITQSLEKWLDEEDDWQRVESAHFVRAWAWHLLGCDLREGQPLQQPGTLLGQLHRQAKKLCRWQWLARIPILWWLKRVSRWMSPTIGEFFKTLVQVEYLLEAEEAATNVLEQALHGEPIVTVRELSNVVGRSGRLTWLQVLTEELCRADVVAFRKAVLRGVNGLEERGLRQVLGLSRRASVEDIHHELSSRMGQIKVNGEVVEAPWWAGMLLQASASFECRLLPLLPFNLQEQLQTVAREGSSSLEYLFGFPELMPVAVEIASLAQELGDTLTAPATLLRPFVPLVKGVLSDWDYVSASNVPVRQLEVASAGVCGEPLYELALRAAGLEDEETRKIGQYYTYYRR